MTATRAHSPGRQAGFGHINSKGPDVKKSILTLAVVIGGVLWAGAPSQAQTQQCPPGQAGNFPYCQVIPPAPPSAPECKKFTAKLSLGRATFLRNNTISILAPITARASGNATIRLQAARRINNYTVPIDSANGRIRVTRPITAAQTRLGTGILNIHYPGDDNTRPQLVRLRAANTPARLQPTRPTISSTGVLNVSGRVNSDARGIVRLQVEFVSRATGRTNTLKFRGTISNGRWSISTQLSATVIAQILQRCGTVHSYILFTGYFPERIRGEMRSFQILPAP